MGHLCRTRTSQRTCKRQMAKQRMSASGPHLSPRVRQRRRRHTLDQRSRQRPHQEEHTKLAVRPLREVGAPQFLQRPQSSSSTLKGHNLLLPQAHLPIGMKLSEECQKCRPWFLPRRSPLLSQIHYRFLWESLAMESHCRHGVAKSSALRPWRRLPPGALRHRHPTINNR